MLLRECDENAAREGRGFSADATRARHPRCVLCFLIRRRGGLRRGLGSAGRRTSTQSRASQNLQHSHRSRDSPRAPLPVPHPNAGGVV